MTTTPLATDTRPSIGDNHPYALATHAFNNAAQIVLGAKLRSELDEDGSFTRHELSRMLARASELFRDGDEAIARFKDLFDRQERLIEEQRVENVTLGRVNEQLERDLRVKLSEELDAQSELTRLRKQLAAAVQLVEELNDDATHRIDQASTYALWIKRVYTQLTGDFQRPMGATPLTDHAPLLTAGAGA